MQGTSFISFNCDGSLSDLQRAFEVALACLERLRAGQLEFRNARARRDKGSRQAAADARKNREVEVAILRLEIIMEESLTAIQVLHTATAMVDYSLRRGNVYVIPRAEVVAKTQQPGSQ
jgi:hypothetical protein